MIENEPVSNRNEIEIANNHSWYLSDDEPLIPLISMSIGKNDVGPFLKLARLALPGGNMSPIYGDPNQDRELWSTTANYNMGKFLDTLDVLPSDVKMVRPQLDQRKDKQPLGILNADILPKNSDPSLVTSIEERSDFVYTVDPTTVLAIRPADCPIIISVGEAKGKPMLCMTHIPWLGADAGYIDQMFSNFDKLGIDRDTLRMFVSAGAHAENYLYSNSTKPSDIDGRDKLFKNVQKDNDGLYHFNIDTPAFVREELLKNGVSEYQIFQDMYDTARDDSVFSSHGRFARSDSKSIDTRDILVASLRQSPQIDKLQL